MKINFFWCPGQEEFDPDWDPVVNSKTDKDDDKNPPPTPEMIFKKKMGVAQKKSTVRPKNHRTKKFFL